MPIAREDEFWVTHDPPHDPGIGVESDRLRECIDRIERDRAKAVFGHEEYGFSGSNLDFLTAVPWVEAVWFWDVALDCVDGLYALEGLEHFGVQPRRPPIDFSRFPRLQHVNLHPRARDSGLERLDSLESLHVWHYRPRDRSFSSLRFPISLRELEINWANTTSLVSLPSLPNLRRLEVHRCRNLVELGDLRQKFPRLEHLVVTTCGKVQRGEAERALADLSDLHHAYVQGVVLR